MCETQEGSCVPRAPLSKTAFGTFNTNLHRRVRCAALGPNTKSSQRQRNCVLTAHRHTAKTKTAAVWRNSHAHAHGRTSTKQTKDLRRSLGHGHLSWACWKRVTCYFFCTTPVVVVRTLLGLGAFACDMGITFDFRLWSDSSVAKFVVGKVSGEFSSTCQTCVRKTR